MALPLHTLKHTGDRCVDEENYFRVSTNPTILLEDWFVGNPHALSHLPAKISREAVKFMDIERAPAGSGIYFLINGDRIVYVGKARSIYSRLEGHWRDGKTFDRYWCLGGIPYQWLGHAEGYYIKQCKPFLNVARVPYDSILDKIARKHRPTWKANEMVESGELVL